MAASMLPAQGVGGGPKLGLAAGGGAASARRKRLGACRRRLLVLHARGSLMMSAFLKRYLLPSLMHLIFLARILRLMVDSETPR